MFNYAGVALMVEHLTSTEWFLKQTLGRMGE